MKEWWINCPIASCNHSIRGHSIYKDYSIYCNRDKSRCPCKTNLSEFISLMEIECNSDKVAKACLKGKHEKCYIADCFCKCHHINNKRMFRNKMILLEELISKINRYKSWYSREKTIELYFSKYVDIKKVKI